MEPTQDFSELVERLTHTKNYRELDLSFIERLVSNAAKASSDEKEILKSVKHAIHQAVNAFRVGEDSYRDLAIQLGDHAIHDRPVEERQLYSADFLRCYASSKERLPFIRRYYQEIFSGLPPIRSILDLGCGLNPIAAVSFIPNGRDLHYTAVDLPLDLVDFLNDFFQFLDLSGTALQGNLLNGAPDIDADLTLIQKIIPVLERSETGAGRRVFDEIRSPFAVVSFPAPAAKAKRSGSAASSVDFETEYDAILSAAGWDSTKLRYPNEIVYVLKR